MAKLMNDYTKYQERMQSQKSICVLAEKYESFEQKLFTNMSKINKISFNQNDYCKTPPSSPIRTNYSGFGKFYPINYNEHKNSFLYRIFVSYQYYIREFSYISNFDDNNFLEFNGNKNLLLQDKRDRNVEIQILYGYYKNYIQFFPTMDPFDSRKIVFLYNFLVFLTFNDSFLFKIGEIENEERFEKFKRFMFLFKQDGSNEQIEIELKNSNYQTSPTKTKIIQYFLTNLF